MNFIILLGIKATVQHSYRAEKDDELDLEEGDVVCIIASRKDGCLRGVKQKGSGWFPGSHIKGCTFDYKCTVLLYHIQSFTVHCMEGYFLYYISGTQATVKYPLHTETDEELHLEEGDIVLVFDKQDDGWWRGMIGERVGLFPGAFVLECTFGAKAHILTFTVTLEVTFYINLLTLGTREIVQYSHRAEKDSELDLVIGDIVQVIGESEDGRCKGIIGEREGWFPRNCISERTYDCCTVVSHSDIYSDCN